MNNKIQKEEIEANADYLELLSKQYPSVDEASTEIINLQAILNLPKGTEHFLTDIHGEYEPFIHVLGNASGVVKSEIECVFGESLSQEDKKELASLIYYPEQKLDMVTRQSGNTDEWYRIMLFRQVEVCRSFSSKYTRSKVRKAIPKNFTYILEELLHTREDQTDKMDYYFEIINTIIDIGRANVFIVAISKLIQRLAIDRLHIIGDIYDRGPGADIIMDTLLKYHSVDIQWGNHDILWMGAASGIDVCIANVIRICSNYGSLDTLENGYGVNLLPLATFAMRFYKPETCGNFLPKIKNEINYDKKEMQLIAQMHKAITVLQFKLEKEIIDRHPEFKLKDRLLLDKIDYGKGTINLRGKTYKLIDTSFPTIDPSDPFKLIDEERDLIEKLRSSFINSEKLMRHMRFLVSKGSLYLIYNSNLLYHGCIPLNEDGSFKEVILLGQKYSGKGLLDMLESSVRKEFYLNRFGKEKHESTDLMWYLWTGINSPLFGKDRMTTFERYFIAEKETHVEIKDPYYHLRNKEWVCVNILKEFGLDPENSHIINGHIPVEAKKGESPIKANGKMLVIDGGFSRAFQDVTGIAGYTLIYDSFGMSLVSHKPFKSIEKAINDESDILASTAVLERETTRKRVADTDIGIEIKQQVKNLKLLLEGYRNGMIKEKNP